MRTSQIHHIAKDYLKPRDGISRQGNEHGRPGCITSKRGQENPVNCPDLADVIIPLFGVWCGSGVEFISRYSFSPMARNTEEQKTGMIL